SLRSVHGALLSPLRRRDAGAARPARASLRDGRGAHPDRPRDERGRRRGPRPPQAEEARVTKLESRRLCIHYGAKQALHGIDIAIATNEVLALIGPSGCGKSTFLRSLNRMNERIPGTWHEGQVLLDGKDIYGRDVDPTDVRRRVGMVFQRPNPFPTSISKNVAYGLEIHGTKS